MGLFGKGFTYAGSGISKNAPKKKGFFRYMELFRAKFWKLIELNIFYTLFFIPLIKWNRRYFLQCPYCGSVRAIGKNEFLALKKGPQEPMALPEKKEDPFGGEFDADAVAANAGESAE